MRLRSYQAQWMKKIVGAIQKGHTVIVENCPEDIDAALNPVLQVKNLSHHPRVIVPLFFDPHSRGNPHEDFLSRVYQHRQHTILVSGNQEH